MVGVQALAKGLAIIASRVGGCGDLVDPGRNGYLADSGDTKAFSKGLRDLLTDPGTLLKARQASRELALRFDIRSVVNKYESVFKDVVP